MSVAWIRGRRKKNGGYHPDVQVIVDSLVSAGLYVCYSNNYVFISKFDKMCHWIIPR